MIFQCPNCRSIRIAEKRTGRKICGTAGTVAGITSGIATVTSGARLDNSADLPRGPTSATISGLVNAFLGGLAGGVAGGAVGAALGDVLDENILGSCECLECGHRFSSPQE